MLMKSVILLMILLPTLAWAEPSIVFQTEAHDFGDVRQGEQPEFAFEFSNGGTDDLVIAQVTTFT